jgi:pyridoxamine 5'-phosphate oxidase
MAKPLANIRKDYQKNILDERHALKDPFAQFGLWIEDAVQRGIEDATAMALATVSEKGFPSVRMVLLKGFDARGFVFFTNYQSRKARHLDSNNNAALTFYWKEAERQLRIEGCCEKVSAQESEEYFNSRPTDSRISAIISPQSKKIPGRPFLEKLKNDFLESGAKPKRPENWGGYRLKPLYFEFWQGRPNRLHDRIVYCPTEGGEWKMRRLAP